MKQERKDHPLKEYRLHGTETFPCAMYHVEAAADRMIVGHHWHDEIELVHFSSGIFLLDISMEKYQIDQPCFCLVNRGELHGFRAVSDGVEDAVVFDPQMASSDTYDAVQQKVIQPLVRGSCMLPRFVSAGDPGYEQMRREFTEMEQVFLEQYEGQRYDDQKLVFDLPSQLLVKGAVMKILAVLTSQGPAVRSGREDNRSAETLKKAITYIQDHYRDKLYIRDLAEAVNMNEQYFCRFFKQGIGKTPMEYVNEYRIRQARSLLLETEQSVTEISLECGFRNQGNFLREFRKYTGTTPLQYRKRAGMQR